MPSPKIFSLILVLLAGLSSHGQLVRAQAGPPAQMRAVVDAVVSTLRSSDQAASKSLASEHLSPDYRQSMSDADWIVHVASLREAVRTFTGELSVEGEPNGVRLLFGGASGVQIRIVVGPQTQWKITQLSLIQASDEAPSDGAPEDAVRRHARAIERLGQLSAEDGLDLLESDHFAAGLLADESRNTLLSELAALRAVIAASGMINLEKRGDLIALQFRGGKPADVVFALAKEPPFRITRFSIDLAPTIPASEPAEKLSWEQLDGRLQTAERDGFSGFVIAQRGGRTVLAKSYGHADRSAQPAASADTVFDIGSMPIDFTRAAVLLLQQQGRLHMDDRIGKYFDAVPEDKRDIRLGHLMDGSSGLPNFHHRDGDGDKDLAWVDRATALARILEQPLLFAPGEGTSHSHSAFGLLAMVVEEVSGEDYGLFLRRHLFAPAGMSRTGFYGEMLGLEESDFAIGYGQPASSPNIPPRWGRASWLVIGSGGMVSSVADMQRGYNYLAGGKLLKGEALSTYQRLRVGMGGSDRGYFFLRVGGDDGDALFLASNFEQGLAGNRQLVRGLIAMVLPERVETPGN